MSGGFFLDFFIVVWLVWFNFCFCFKQPNLGVKIQLPSEQRGNKLEAVSGSAKAEGIEKHPLDDLKNEEITEKRKK